MQKINSVSWDSKIACKSDGIIGIERAKWDEWVLKSAVEKRSVLIDGEMKLSATFLIGISVAKLPRVYTTNVEGRWGEVILRELCQIPKHRFSKFRDTESQKVCLGRQNGIPCSIGFNWNNGKLSIDMCNTTTIVDWDL